jgi:hypothetical protein
MTSSAPVTCRADRGMVRVPAGWPYELPGLVAPPFQDPRHAQATPVGRSRFGRFILSLGDLAKPIA